MPVGNLQQQQWSNETIQNILESSFVFWQRSTSSSAGQNFQRLYSSGAEEMPQIVIIGPTGAKILTHTGFIQADDLSMMLVEFLDSNDLDSTVAPTLNQSGRRSRSGSDLGSANGMGSRTSSVGAGMGGVGGGGGGGGGDMGMGDGRGGSGSGSGAAAMSEEERALAEAIRLSMLDAEGGGGSGEAGEAGEGGEVDDLAARLDGQTLGDDEEEQYELDDDGVLPGGSSSSSSSSSSSTTTTSAAAAEAKEEAKAAEAKAALLPSHLPEGWEEWSASGAGRSEPAKGTPGTTRVQLRLATGKTVVRRFFANEDPVAAIYAVAVEQVGRSMGRRVERRRRNRRRLFPG